MDRRVFATVTVICLMKFCSKMVEMQFVNYPTVCQQKNCSMADDPNQQNTLCQDYSAPISSWMEPFTSWTFTMRYLLPVLGGGLASARLGYVRVLQIGGVFMLLAAVLMSVTAYLGLMCQSPAIVPITWLLLPLYFGLTQPNIMYGLFRGIRQGRQCMIVAALYYAVSSLAEWLAIGFLSQRRNSDLGSFYTLVLIALSILFILISLSLPKETVQGPFVIYGQARMRRIFIVFSGIVPFLIATASEARSIVYQSELTYYLNLSKSSAHQFPGEIYLLSPDWQRYLSLAVFSALLMLVGMVSPRPVPIRHRMLAGVLLEAAVALGLAIFSLHIDQTTPAVTIAAYFVVSSILDAAAEVLVMIANFELANEIAEARLKSFLIGVMMTVWIFPHIVGRGIVAALSSLSHLLQPQDNPQFYVFHLTAFCVLIVGFVYLNFYALPIAFQMIQWNQAAMPVPEVNESLYLPRDEYEPLLNPRLQWYSGE